MRLRPAPLRSVGGAFLGALTKRGNSEALRDFGHWEASEGCESAVNSSGFSVHDKW